MTNEEKYYRRCYKVLKELNDCFKFEINEEKVLKYILEKSNMSFYNEKVLREEDISFLLTLIITLIGLNKEEVEEKFNIKYERNIIDFDIFEIINNENSKKLKENLISSKVIDTEFKNWLYIVKTSSKKNINSEAIKNVRNGLLHSYFKINYDGDINLINIRNKSYFEANVVYQNFLQFAISYFGNNIGIGLSTNNMIFITNPKININNLFELKQFLKELDIFTLVLDNSDNKFHDDILYKNRNINKELDFKFVDELKGKVKNFNQDKLSLNQIDFISDYINKTYGNNFYALNRIIKQNYITELCSLIFNSKNYLSSWLLYLFDIFAKISHNGNPILKASEPNLCQEGFYISLALLKSYLVLYRLQVEEFNEINFDYINIDLNKIGVYKSNDESLLKIQEKYPNLDNDTYQKIEIIQIFRNSLAHGDIKVLLSKDNVDFSYELLIEFTDEYKKSLRKLYIPLEELNKFLDSEVFLPRYCYSNIETKVKKL